MITVRFFQKPERGSIHMIVGGHARDAPKGQDLICAAATAVTYAVAQAVQFMAEQGQLARKPLISLKDGQATIVVTPLPEHYEEALHTFFVGQCGMHCLSRNYPKNVQVCYFDAEG